MEMISKSVKYFPYLSESPVADEKLLDFHNSLNRIDSGMIGQLELHSVNLTISLCFSHTSAKNYCFAILIPFSVILSALIEKLLVLSCEICLKILFVHYYTTKHIFWLGKNKFDGHSHPGFCRLILGG